MNLDLGGTIWLDVSRKLLGFHKWFFAKLEDMPKKVFEEFRRHSHTHPNATITSSSKQHDHWAETTDINCGEPHGLTHEHGLYFLNANLHSHPVVVSFAAANLGVPNWWEHRHAISLVTFGLGGGSHRHFTSTLTADSSCDYTDCYTGPHHHNCSYTCGSGGSIHTHTLPSPRNTDYADPAGTPENHRHEFLLYSVEADNHRHSTSGTVAFARCHFDYNHEHAIPIGSDTYYVKHRHTVEGYSGYGGEPEVPPVVKVSHGDGLTWWD